MKVISVLVLLYIGFLNVLNIEGETGPPHSKVVVCYISTWAVYRPDQGSFSLDNIDPTLCTHLVYAFAGLDVERNTIKSLDPWQDLKDDFGRDGYQRLTGLKQTYPHLKVTLAIGGWNEGSLKYSQLVANPNRRRDFVQKTVAFVRKFNFDGLDLDWEYPTQRGGAPADKENFVSLVRELRAELNKYKLILTSAFGASIKVINEAYDVRVLNGLFDFFHIMSYDYGGSWDKKVSYNSPLTDSTELNVMRSIEEFIRLGASPHKVILGLPFYGRTFTAKGEGNLGDPTVGPAFQGPYTKEDGFMGYNEICEAKLNDTLKDTITDTFDPVTSQSILKIKEIGDDITKVVTYDSARSIANKVRYAFRRGLGGVMVWSIDTDDFIGLCEPDKDTYADFKPIAGVTLHFPKEEYSNFKLLRTINSAMNVAYDELTQENIIKEKDKDNEIPTNESKKKGSGNGGSSVHFNSLGLFIANLFACMFVFLIKL